METQINFQENRIFQQDFTSSIPKGNHIKINTSESRYDLTDIQWESLVNFENIILEEIEKNKQFQHQNRAKITEREQLIRQLKAREFNIEKAKEMWVKWVNWRIEYEIDKIDASSVESELKSGKAFWHKYDKEGNPCCIVQVRNHVASETTHRNTIRFLIYLMEKGILMAEKSGTKRMSVIWDRQGFSSKNFDFSFITLIKSLVSMFQDNYAERLAHVYILHPSFFMRQAFNVFSPLLAQKVREKIHILNEIQELQNFFNPNQILKEHGGQSEFSYSYPENVFCDPLGALQPSAIPNDLGITQIVQEENNFSFANKQDDSKQLGNDGQCSSFFSIENNSTEFFNLHAECTSFAKERTIYESSEPDLQFDDIHHRKLEFGRSKEYGERENQDQNHMNQILKGPSYLPIYQSPNEENDVNISNRVITSSGCCGCSSSSDGGSSCIIF